MKVQIENQKWNKSAGIYAANVESIRFYQETNQRIVAAADIQPGMVVADLACGSGMTTRRICETMKGKGKVFAIDSSTDMLAQAKRAANSGIVSFLKSDAGAFADQVTEKVDRVLCNSAFWHFNDPSSVLAQCRKVLKPKGWMLFNIPDQDFDFGDGKPSQMRQTVSKCLNTPSRANTKKLNKNMIQKFAEQNNFEISDHTVFGIDIGPKDLIRFYSIPHVSEKRFPELPYEERVKIIENAFSKLDRDTRITYRWAQFCLQLKNDS